MKLLITGGAGFIGSNFIRYWLEKYPKDYVTNLDKLTYAGHVSSLKNLDSNSHYQFVKGDICNPQIVEKVISGVELVVHFAAESHVDRSILKPAEFIKTNVLGTQVLLDVAKKHQLKKFHHISTDEVFGSIDLKSTSKFSELTPYNPHSPYSASKASSDHLVRSYYHTFGVPITISNCSNNYGPFQDPEKFIPRMITNLLMERKIPVYGTGVNVRDWLHVTDHCRAIDLILEKGKTGETYCIGGQKQLFNNLAIAKKIIQLFGKDSSWIEFVKDRPGHDLKYAVNWSKINRELKWEPQYNLDKGLKDTVNWYRENSWWWRPLKSSAESLYKK
jgi:dTDP-glucose 4,6-dehydratase